MENVQELHFYSPKVKNFYFLIIGLVFIAFGVVICVHAYKKGDLLAFCISVLCVLFFGLLTFIMFKKLWNTKPYLILNDEELIINAFSKNNIPIKWIDIEGYYFREVSFNKFIEVVLNDEEKYRSLMSSNMRRLNKLNEAMNFASFAIAWGQVKRKDRDKLVQELDRRTFKEGYQMISDDIEEKHSSQVNGKYLLKSYGFSLILTGVLFLLFNMQSNYDNMPFLIISFILYPFARIVYDVLLGFKFDYKMKKQTFLIVYFIQFRFIIHLVIYYVSFALAPFGFLYLIFRAIHRFEKKEDIGVIL